jgi:hypothetical protein
MATRSTPAVAVVTARMHGDHEPDCRDGQDGSTRDPDGPSRKAGHGHPQVQLRGQALQGHLDFLSCEALLRLTLARSAFRATVEISPRFDQCSVFLQTRLRPRFVAPCQSCI